MSKWIKCIFNGWCHTLIEENKYEDYVCLSCKIERGYDYNESDITKNLDERDPREKRG